MPEVPPIDLSSPLRIHLVGIGGAGISAIALILARMGHQVSGVDICQTPVWSTLLEAGVAPDVVDRRDLFHSPLAVDAQVVAHSTAYAPTEQDRARARSDGTALVDRATILAAICAVRPTVAVSGTHGKTSTTAMLATALDGAGADPSFLVGAVPVDLGVAARWADQDGPFVVEADESDGSFLALGASVALVTNIDEDHLDHWGSIEAIEEAFDHFVGAAERAVICIDDPGGHSGAQARAVRVAERHGAVTVGEDPRSHYLIHDVEVRFLTTTFGLRVDGVEVGPVSLETPGRHHARNAAMAVAAAASLGIDPVRAVAALAAYRGVARRFEVIGEAAGVVVVDDYAHNPGKLRALVTSASEAGWARVVVLFQPHRYSRTRDQGIALGEALASADVVAITDVYGAGEEPVPGVDGKLVLDALLGASPQVEAAWVPTLDDVEVWARARLRPGDLCLTVGAGDISGLGPRLLAGLQARTAS